MNSQWTAQAKAERRTGRRYPVEVDLEFRIVRGRSVVEAGSGQTVDISNSGVLFESAHALPLGADVELAIVWPAQQPNTERLKLHITGRTVRAEGNRTAVQVAHQVFRFEGIPLTDAWTSRN